MFITSSKEIKKSLIFFFESWITQFDETKAQVCAKFILYLSARYLYEMIQLDMK